MKVLVKLLLSCEKQTGVSQATGRPWTSKEAVFETLDGKDTFPVKTLNEELISMLEGSIEGDEFEAEIQLRSRAKEYKRQDGTFGMFRSVDVSLVSLVRTREEAL